MNPWEREVASLRPKLWWRNHYPFGAVSPAPVRDFAGVNPGSYAGTGATVPGPPENPGGVTVVTNAWTSYGSATGLPSGGAARTILSVVLPTRVDGTRGLGGLGNGAGGGQDFNPLYGGLAFTDGVNVGNNLAVPSGYQPTVGKWNLMGFSLNGSNGYQLWRDGVMRSSGTFSTSINTMSGIVSAGVRTDVTGERVDGAISDFCVFNYALSANAWRALEAARRSCAA